MIYDSLTLLYGRLYTEDPGVPTAFHLIAETDYSPNDRLFHLSSDLLQFTQKR